MLTKEQIEQIVAMTVAQMNGQPKAPAGNAPAAGNGWMFDRAEDCIKAAAAAQKQLVSMTMEARESFIRAMRKAAVDNAEYLAQLAHDETGYGRVRIKFRKFCWWQTKRPGQRIFSPGCSPATRD